LAAIDHPGTPPLENQGRAELLGATRMQYEVGAGPVPKYDNGSGRQRGATQPAAIRLTGVIDAHRAEPREQNAVAPLGASMLSKSRGPIPALPKVFERMYRPARPKPDTGRRSFDGA
jgi:hypothetical protein